MGKSLLKDGVCPKCGCKKVIEHDDHVECKHCHHWEAF